MGKKSVSRRELHNKIWYYGIKPGTYTTNDFAEMTEHRFKNAYILQNLKRMGVEQVIPENRIRNEKYWIWKGDDFYIKRRIEEDII